MAADDAHDETATSGVVPPARPARADGFRAGEQLGRYVIERVLGAGGMGLVYAAHDPDLDRRVAIKVLRGDASDDSRVRLLREARAMAKLSHPNVITVYEVGTAAGVDFVAMELLEGGTLGEWLRAERRAPAEVLRRFRAAGAGLAAAHARGLVHRDFKPANVLLGRDGQVVVTDFGLARGFDSDAVAATLPAAAAPPAQAVARSVELEDTVAATPSPSRSPSRSQPADLASTLTRTGAVLGTPAYMAPEQFAGGQVGPWADQFAFAVALWEGLVGQRPYRGATLEELRAAVERGAPDVGALPRSVRSVLQRALARDAAARWPDMTALLAALDRRVRRPRQLALVAAVGAVVIVTGGAFALRERSRQATPAGVACALTDRDLDLVWSPTQAAALAAHLGDARWGTARPLFDSFAARWKAERATTCAAPGERTYHGRLTCLAGLRDEFAALTEMLGQLPIDAIPDEAWREMVPEPDACRSGRRTAMPPLPTDPATRAAFSEVVRAASTAGMVARGPNPKAARAIAEGAVAQARQIDYAPALAIALQAEASVVHVAGDCAAAAPLYEDTATAAEAAGADGIRAMAQIGLLECAISRSSDLAEIQRRATAADAAIQRAGDDRSLRAALDSTLAQIDGETGDYDTAIARTERALATFVEVRDARRAAHTASVAAAYRMARGADGDLDRAYALAELALAQTATAFGPDHPMTGRMRMQLGLFTLDRDPAAARAMIDLGMAAVPEAEAPADARAVRGRVRGPDGAPVVGAQVFAATSLVAPADGVPLSDGSTWTARATTDAAGRFELRASPGSVVYAITATEAARPVRVDGDDVDLRLVATARLRVHAVVNPPAAAAADAPRELRLAGTGRAVGVVVNFVDRGRILQIFGRRDGDDAWVIDRVPAGPVSYGVVTSSALGDGAMQLATTTLTAGRDAALELAVDLRGKVVDIIVRAERSGTIPTARVLVAPGRVARLPTTAAGVWAALAHGRTLIGLNAAPVVEATRTSAGAGRYLPDDIHARVGAIPPGPLTICVIPFAGDLRDRAFMAPLVAADDLEVRCRVVEVGEAPIQAFVIETPPMKRLP